MIDREECLDMVMRKELAEEQQAAAVRELADAAAGHQSAREATKRATDRLRRAVIAALVAGVSTRRAAKLARVAHSTVIRWSKAAAETTDR